MLSNESVVFHLFSKELWVLGAAVVKKRVVKKRVLSPFPKLTLFLFLLLSSIVLFSWSSVKKKKKSVFKWTFENWSLRPKFSIYYKYIMRAYDKHLLKFGEIVLTFPHQHSCNPTRISKYLSKTMLALSPLLLFKFFLILKICVFFFKKLYWDGMSTKFIIFEN